MKKKARETTLVFSENKKPENTILWRSPQYELTRLAVGLGMSVPNLFRYSPQDSFESILVPPSFITFVLYTNANLRQVQLLSLQNKLYQNFFMLSIAFFLMIGHKFGQICPPMIKY